MSENPSSNEDTKFVDLTEAELDLILTAKSSESTKRLIKVAVKTFEEHCSDKGEALPIVCDAKLCELLRTFYAETRRKNGILYNKNTLASIRYALRKYYLERNGVDIVNHELFKPANKMFKAVLVKLEDLGHGTVLHKWPIPSSEMIKLYNSEALDMKTPKSLQNKVFVDVMLHFPRLGKENLWELRKNDFLVVTDENGEKFIKMLDKVTQKNCTDVESIIGRMYATNNCFCPVASFLKYFTKLNHECDFFWQRPRDPAINLDTWYDSIRIGINKLQCFMKRLSEEAGLSQKYTNHCLRITSRLDRLEINCCTAGGNESSRLAVTQVPNSTPTTRVVPVPVMLMPVRPLSRPPLGQRTATVRHVSYSSQDYHCAVNQGRRKGIGKQPGPSEVCVKSEQSGSLSEQSGSLSEQCGSCCRMVPGSDFKVKVETEVLPNSDEQTTQRGEQTQELGLDFNLDSNNLLQVHSLLPIPYPGAVSGLLPIPSPRIVSGVDLMSPLPDATELSHKCSAGRKASSSRLVLLRHLRASQKSYIKLFCCPLCKFVSKRVEGVRKHILSVHRAVARARNRIYENFRRQKLASKPLKQGKVKCEPTTAPGSTATMSPGSTALYVQSTVNLKDLTKSDLLNEYDRLSQIISELTQHKDKIRKQLVEKPD